MSDLTTTVSPFTSGLDAITGSGPEWTVTFAGTWRQCDRPTIILTDTASGEQTQYGAGDTTGIEASFLYTYGHRVYALSEDYAYFSAIGFPAVFNDPNAVGNGYIQMSGYYAEPQSLVAMAHYQGRLAFMAKNTVQVWITNSDPTLFQQSQVLENLGTFAPLTVQSIGDLDVIMLHSSGVRSLRARDSSLNAFVIDIGSPIDQLIIDALESQESFEQPNACSVVELTTNRYWLFVKDTIYVLSYFPNNKIVAWSTYLPTYEEAGVTYTFTPEKMVAYEGQVYVRDIYGKFYLYGGTNNATYDNCTATLETPWLDNKRPASSKFAKALDYAIGGQWKASYGLDPLVGNLSKVGTLLKSSFDIGRVPITGRGTHFKLKFESQGATAAKVSEIIYHYNDEDNK